MLECGLESRLGFEFSSFSVWHFLKLVVEGFFPDTPVYSPPSSVDGSANKISSNKCDFSFVKLDSGTVPSYQVAHDMLHVKSARCVARDVHTVAPGHISVRVGDRSRCSEETAPPKKKKKKKISICACQCDHCYHYDFRFFFPVHSLLCLSAFRGLLFPLS